jgi:hypothetical protein
VGEYTATSEPACDRARYAQGSGGGGAGVDRAGFAISSTASQTNVVITFEGHFDASRFSEGDLSESPWS